MERNGASATDVPGGGAQYHEGRLQNLADEVID